MGGDRRGAGLRAPRRYAVVTARLDWSASDLLAIFPFRHCVELAASLRLDALTLETTLTAGSDSPVPVSFGFHPYLRLPEPSRKSWQLQLPEMRKLMLDEHGIPTGEEAPFGGFNGSLGELSFDDGFALPREQATFAVASGGYRIGVEFLEGYRYTQVFAPRDMDYVAVEPMTAPTSALTTGRSLRIVGPDKRFRAVFRIRIDGPQ
jgi:aldose 1-epimerase